MELFTRFFKPNVEELKKKRDTNGLLQALTHKNEAIRCQAAVALLQLGDMRGKDYLVNVLSGNHDDNMHKTAAQALVEVADPNGIQFFTARLQHQNTNERVKAALVLGEQGIPQGIDFFSAVILEEQGATRALVASAMTSKIVDYPAMKEFLTAHSHDESQSIRQAIVTMLAKTAPPWSIEILIAALKDTDPAIQFTAQHGLEQMKDARGQQTVTERRNQMKKTVGTISAKFPVALDVTSGHIAVGTGSKYQLFRINDLKSPTELSFGHYHSMDHLAFDNSGRNLAIAKWSSDHSQDAYLFKLETGSYQHFTKGQRQLTGAGLGGSETVCFSPESDLLAVSETFGSRIDLLSIKHRGNSLFSLKPNGLYNLEMLNWSPDGKTLAQLLAGVGSGIKIVLWKIERHENEELSATSVAFSYLAKNSPYNQKDKRIGLTFSPDSRLLVIGSSGPGDSIRIFDVETTNLLYQTPKLDAGITSLVFYPSGNYLLAGARDETLRLWQITRPAQNEVSSQELEKLSFAGDIVQFGLIHPELKVLVAYKKYDSIILSEVTFPAELR